MHKLFNVIAWPLAYVAMSRWLENFAHRTTIEVGGRRPFQTGSMSQLPDASFEPPVRANSIAGTWETHFSGAIGLFAGDTIRLTEAGRRARASYNETTMLPGWDCTPYSAT